MRHAHAERKSPERGFTMVEVLMVIVISTVGFLALVQLQVGTLKGVANARSMSQGVNLAEHFIETLKSEAISWNMDATLMIAQTTRFPRLRLAGNPAVGGGSGWVRGYTPLTGSDRRVGPMGMDDPWDAGVANEVSEDRERKFCVHYRLTWVVPNYLLRADVRVSWPKPDVDETPYLLCPAGMEQQVSDVNSVTLSGTVMRNVFSGQ